jgi:AGZA family xanthine/uracil permease-like MFS transporter
MGARIGYSALNGIVITLLCLLGLTGAVLRIVPMEVTLGVLVWVGIVITAQAFSDSPTKHSIAVAIGLIPCLAGWAALLVETVARSANASLKALATQTNGDLVLTGLFSLGQGFLLTSILISAMTAFVIDRRFLSASLVALVGSLFSIFGLIHAVILTAYGSQPVTGWWASPSFAAAYAATSLVLVGLFFLNRSKPCEATHP